MYHVAHHKGNNTENKQQLIIFLKLKILNFFSMQNICPFLSIGNLHIRSFALNFSCSLSIFHVISVFYSTNQYRPANPWHCSLLWSMHFTSFAFLRISGFEIQLFHVGNWKLIIHMHVNMMFFIRFSKPAPIVSWIW